MDVREREVRDQSQPAPEIIQQINPEFNFN
jgi:hypothetical protein